MIEIETLINLNNYWFNLLKFNQGKNIFPSKKNYLTQQQLREIITLLYWKFGRICRRISHVNFLYELFKFELEKDWFGLQWGDACMHQVFQKVKVWLGESLKPKTPFQKVKVFKKSSLEKLVANPTFFPRFCYFYFVLTFSWSKFQVI